MTRIQNDSIPVNCCTVDSSSFVNECECEAEGDQSNGDYNLMQRCCQDLRVTVRNFEISHNGSFLSLRSRLRGLKIDAPKSSNCGINLAEFSTRTIIIRILESINQSIDRSIDR